MGETLLITNYEVEEPRHVIDERDGVKIYGGGINGIRALRQTKGDNEEETKMSEQEKLKKHSIENQGDKFKRYEHKISKKNRLIIK